MSSPQDIPLALTFDDVLLCPAHSRVLPKEVDVRTRLSERIQLRIPILSSAMDTVTESRTAIAMAQNGGLGVIHKNLSIERQAREVAIVKRTVAGMIAEPITVSPDRPLREALELMRRHSISGLPVTSSGGPDDELVGILTEKDCLNVMTKGRDADVATGTVGDYMTANPVTLSPKMDIYYAAGLFLNHEFRRLPVVEDGLLLVGAITRFDLLRAVRNNWQ